MSTQPPWPPEPFVQASLVQVKPRSTPSKLLAPAIALLCIAGFNGLYELNQFKDLVIGPSRAEREQLEKILGDEDAPELIRNAVHRILDGGAGKWFGAVVSTAFTIGIAAGGVAMIRMRMYPLALTGAILSVVPCATIMGCCGAGQAVGIWAIVVLANPEVRGWFR